MLPQRFCWAKFGAEAGEGPDAIIRRKEAERVANMGVFLWGIGNSIRPSLLALIDSTMEPIVAFTPMRSPAARRDSSPHRVGVWRNAVGLDGQPFDIPDGSQVTSGLRDDEMPTRHYALVCLQDSPLVAATNDEMWLDDEQLRNIRTGVRVGSSQVTSVVERSLSSTTRQRYRVAFSAKLVAPFHLVLSDCAPIS